LNKKKIKYLYFNYYLQEVCLRSKGPVVALITCEGPIHVGKSQRPGFNDPSIGHETVVRAIESAANDKHVKAILLRVESPGGSYVGSDHIARAIIKAKEKGKKIIVSMSNVAASGGYYISVNSDRIVANPLTITGSIGVVAGKFNARKLYEEHLGITFDGVVESDLSNLFSGIEGMSEENERKYEELLDEIYSDFKSKVVIGRNHPELTEENINDFAQGRIWTGTDALNIKLIDHLGGFTTAINVTKELLELTEKDSISLKEYPRKKSWFKLLFHSSKRSSRDHHESSEISVSPSVLMGSFGSNFIQSVILNSIYQFLGVHMSYNPFSVYSKISDSQVNLLAPNYSMGFLSKD